MDSGLLSGRWEISDELDTVHHWTAHGPTPTQVPSIPTQHSLVLTPAQDTCDVGTLANQSYTDTTPPGAHVHGDAGKGGELSYLPGQRLSACTCKGEAHPGPTRPDGSFVGRAAPEIDMFEAQVDGNYIGHVSQSGQWAPFNYG
jgi:hypothetical protein